MKKRTIAVLMILVLLFGLTGCERKDSKKIKITMYLWDKPMTRELTPWLEEQFPDIDFTFVVGYNTMDYYMDLNDRGSLPDIITCRRFSLNDAAQLSDSLLDLSETDVVGSYYDSYIENNRETSGAIHWLPMCAEVDGYIANLDLFEDNHIPVPTNEAEFADACMKFEELGIRGFTNDYRMDYSCMEALQGCAIPELMGMDGIVWRAKYESETDENPVSLDDKVWPVVFQKFEQYLEDTRVTPADADLKYENMRDAFLEKKSAIVRGTAEDCINFRNVGLNAVMLPYFGETEDDNWILTYPAFQVAVNHSVEQDEKKKDAIIQVLEAMLSEEGQKRVAAGSAMLSYNKNVNFQMNEVFTQVSDCISSNRMYMRLASTEMFAISRNVVQNMITGKYDKTGAYDDFNAQLTETNNQETIEYVTTQKNGYEYDFGKHGSPAASAVINTLRKQTGDDIAVGIAGVVTSSVFEGDYNINQINRLLDNGAYMTSGTLTGAEIKMLMEWLVNAGENGNPIRHKNLIPVTSGMEYQMKANGDGTYTLEEITVIGNALEDDTLYTISLFGDIYYIEDPIYCNCPMPDGLKNKMEVRDDNVYDLFRTALENGQQMAEPTDYVTVK
ncbi:MAG: 5'-nucleotidase C-terminal domain-containing protein [Lachnospiraceae bacterium]